MGNFESMGIFDFLTWLTIICRPLSLNMLAYWYGHLVYQRAMLFSGVFCLEEWMKSWEKLTSLSSFFPTLLSPTHRLSQWYFPRSLFSLVFGCSIWNVLPSLASHSWLPFEKAIFMWRSMSIFNSGCSNERVTFDNVQFFMKITVSALPDRQSKYGRVHLNRLSTKG